MTHTLPAIPNLEQLKNQAKDLLKAYRARHLEAVRRVEPQLASPSDCAEAAITLASVQHVIAREYGFPSWPRLKQHVQSLQASAAQKVSLQQQVERLGVRDWRVILAADAELARAGSAGIGAVIEGLSHPQAPVRRACARFMDQHGTDACVPGVRELALHDPVPSVRRAAVHAVGCQRCKPSPLTTDTVEFLVKVLFSDSNLKVRREVVSVFMRLPSDPRAAAALKLVLQQDTDRELLRLAHLALKRQNPNYRKAADERARQQGIARTQANRQN